MSHSPNNFLGLSDELSSYSKAKVAVLPIPYEATVSYGKGTAKGPNAIINASQQVELFDEELWFEPYEVGVATLESLPVDGVHPSKIFDVITPSVSRIIADGKLPIMLGGEHSITPAIVKAFANTYKSLTVVQFDAHADLREEYEGESMSHACAMARTREMCPVVHLGIRNISKGEVELVEREKPAIFFAHEIHNSKNWMDAAIKAIKTDNVYVTIDVDAFDSSIMPATGTPEPGGMDWYQVTGFLKKLTENKKVVGFDLVELAPKVDLHGCDFLVAKLAYKCIGYWLRGKK